MHSYRFNKEIYTVVPPQLETPGHYNIRTILYFLAQTTREGVIMSDPKDLHKLCDLIQSATDDAKFSELFPIDELVAYRNEHGLPLRGSRRSEWIIQHEIPRGSTTDAKKYIAGRVCQIFRQETLYHAADKLYTMLNGKFIASHEHEFSVPKAAEIVAIRSKLTDFLGKTPA